MNYNIASCLLFILVVICLVFYMNIPESFTIQQKQLFLSNNIKENFSDGIENLKNDINNAKTQEEEAKKKAEEEAKAKEKEKEEKDPIYTLEPDLLIQNSQEFNNMIDRLNHAETLCGDREISQEKKDLAEEVKINEQANEELDIQETRIEELKGILKKLQAEKMRSQKINNKCHANKQKIVNTDYQIIKELMKNSGDIGKDKSVNLDLNVSDSLKKLKGSFKYDFDNDKINYKMTTTSPAQNESKVNKIKKNTLSKTEIENLKKTVAGSYMVPNDVKFVTKKEIEENYKKCEIDKEKYIDINELQFGICKGCDPNVIKPKISQINKDFK
jgi:hypothetical protein